MPPSFLDLGVSAEIAERLAHRGITEPFPIQAATLPDALAGRDVCGRAPTGSGKTLAFGIPLVTLVGKARPRRPQGLVLVPTRELAAQVQRELTALAGPRGRRIAAFYGGVGFGPQLAALRSGVDIVVACPGRLADLVRKGEMALDGVRMVVVDEADRMADMGFLPEVRRLLDQVNPDRQTMLFSATLDGDVDVLIRRYQRSPRRHELAPPDDAAHVEHLFWRAERPERVALTAAVVNRSWPAIVFCRTKHGADRLTRQLGVAGVSAAPIHGDRSQSQRERALADFTAGRVQALVATDIAARGIHVEGVACVVHFDLPADDKDYVHRSGRTGRAGAGGTVVSMVPREQSSEVRKLQAKLGLPTHVGTPAPQALDGEATVSERPKSAPRPAATARPADDFRPRQRTGRPRRPAPARTGGRGPGPRPTGRTRSGRRPV